MDVQQTDITLLLTSKKTEQNKDNMVLEIQLVKQDELPNIMPKETNVHNGEMSTSIPDETNVPNGEMSTSIPDENNVPTGELSSIIPDNIYQDLLAELTKDPDLSTIFNGFDVLEEDNVIVDYESIHEPTPLEWELHNLGY